MLCIVSSDKREIYKHDLDHYFRLRKRIFIDKLGWELKSYDGKEIDQFDHDHAHYLLYKSPETGKIEGGVRLTSSTAPNLTLDVFSYLVDSNHKLTPSSTTWEVSRFVIDSTSTPKHIIGEASFRIFIGMIEFGLLHNFDTYVTLTMVAIERLARMAHWELLRLSKVEKIGNTNSVFGTLEVSEKVSNKIRDKSGIWENVFLETDKKTN